MEVKPRDTKFNLQCSRFPLWKWFFQEEVLTKYQMQNQYHRLPKPEI